MWVWSPYAPFWEWREMIKCLREEMSGEGNVSTWQGGSFTSGLWLTMGNRNRESKTVDKWGQLCLVMWSPPFGPIWSHVTRWYFQWERKPAQQCSRWYHGLYIPLIICSGLLDQPAMKLTTIPGWWEFPTFLNPHSLSTEATLPDLEWEPCEVPFILPGPMGAI